MLAELVRAALAAELGDQYADADPLIRPSQFADFQSNVALPLAKGLGRPPREIAAAVAARLAGGEPGGPVATAQMSGPGTVISLTVGANNSKASSASIGVHSLIKLIACSASSRESQWTERTNLVSAFRLARRL